MEKKHVVVWDLDGVIIGSIRECFESTIGAMERNRKEIEKAMGKRFEDIPYKDFKAFRPIVVHDPDLFTLPLTRQKYNLDFKDKTFEEKRDVFEKEQEVLVKKLISDYYAIREESIKRDRNAWIRSNPLFKGVDKIIRFLADSRITQVIISSKNREPIREILSHYGLLKYFHKIYGMEDLAPSGERKQTKAYPFRELREEFPNATFHFIDDSPGAHREVGEHPDVRHVLPAWGYGEGHGGEKIKSPKHLMRYMQRIVHEDQTSDAHHNKRFRK